MITFDKFKGCLLGLAVGDALGMPLEFKKERSSELVTDMIQRWMVRFTNWYLDR